MSGDVLVRFEFQYSGVLGGNDFLGLYFGAALLGMADLRRRRA
jgi:hypothetical protein